MDSFNAARFANQQLKDDACHVSSSCYEVLRQMGAIFVTKCSLTLQTDMLGTPEILWEHDQFDAHIPQVFTVGTVESVNLRGMSRQ